jgi:hypothetical protein
MNETELLALYREIAALRKQLADAQIREMDLSDNISIALDYLTHDANGTPQKHIDELICLLNGE